MESPGFARAAVSMRGSFPGQEGELEAETLLAPPLLQVSDVIQGEGDWRGSDRQGRGLRIPSFLLSAAIQWIAALPNVAALQGEGQSQ